MNASTVPPYGPAGWDVRPDGPYDRVGGTAVPDPGGWPARLAEEGDALNWDARRNRPGW
ncbi:hypothetical protein [Streptomyces varsoviensis]|uniref:hypothetical protein n=1 Tax=Streptomyces varsoviensis TaxID=67373 RepID=UPI0012FF1214|nr:hypothetical protein [Streptomyces varsoviensis]